MKLRTMVMEGYESPKVELIEIEVEKGFAVSTEPVGDRNDDIDW